MNLHTRDPGEQRQVLPPSPPPSPSLALSPRWTPPPVSESVPRRPPLLNGSALCLLAFVVALAWSLHRAGLFGATDGPLVNTGGWSLVRRFIVASLHPDLSPDLLSLTGRSALITVSFAVCGTALAVLFGLVGGVFASQVWWQLRAPGTHRNGNHSKGLSWLAVRGLLALPRSIHEAVWGLLLLTVLGLNPLVAVLAIAIPFGAITAKVYAEILDETPQDALRVLSGSGVPPVKAILYGLLPPASPALLSYGLYRLECALRSATVLGLIGAGGLGYEILLSLQSLRYEQVWTFLYALIFLVGITDAASSYLNSLLNVTRQTEVHVLEPRRHHDDVASLADSNGNESTTAESSALESAAKASLGGLAIAAVILLLIGAAFRHVGIDVRTLTSERTMRLAKEALDGMFPPRMDTSLLIDLSRLSVDTLAMSIVAMTLAGAIGLISSYWASSNLMLPYGFGVFSSGRRLWRNIAGATILVLTRVVLLVARALSEAIWVLLVLFVFFPGILPGAIALGLYNGGVLGRLMTEVNENASDLPRRALAAQGASGAQTIFYGLLPQTLPRCIAYILYRWEVCIRATAIVGIVGAGGLGRRLDEQLNRFDYPAVFTILLFYLALTFLVDMISALVRRTVR
jgi:phosphonate transport system permease protein